MYSARAWPRSDRAPVGRMGIGRMVRFRPYPRRGRAAAAAEAAPRLSQPKYIYQTIPYGIVKSHRHGWEFVTPTGWDPSHTDGVSLHGPREPSSRCPAYAGLPTSRGREKWGDRPMWAGRSGA